MKAEKKIFLELKDDVDSALEKLAGSPAEVVIFNIPRESLLGRTIDNFHLLRKECAALGKELIIESVDERVLEFASLAQLTAVNPVFRQKERMISDILPRSKRVMAKKPAESAKPWASPQTFKPAPPPPPFQPPPKKRSFPAPRPEPKIIYGEGRFKLRRFALPLAVLALVIGAFFAMNAVLPKATVAMTFKKTPVSFEETVEVNVEKTEAVLSDSKIILPGELLTANRNLSLRFPANGREKVERKAKGALVVWNAYSSEPQTLVPTTRFASPDGKIFRLDERTVVPAALIKDGKIVPSKIGVKVTADKPGEDYNVGPRDNWRIPGFQGTPRYEGFYAESGAAMTGGFVGETVVPTKEDVEAGRKILAESLKEALKSQMIILLSPQFKVFGEAESFRIIREETEPADGENKFGIFAEAELKYLVFDEKMLTEAVTSKFRRALALSGVRVRDFAVSYGPPSGVQLADGKMTFSAKGEIVFEPDVDFDDLKTKILGRNEADLRKTVFLLPDLQKANVSLWPFWVKKVPVNPDKVKFVVE